MIKVVKEVFIGEARKGPESQIEFNVDSYQKGHELMRNLISIDRIVSDRIRNKHYPVLFDPFSNGLGFMMSYSDMDGIHHHNAYGIIDEDEDSD